MAAARSFVVAALAVVVVLAFAHAFTVDQRVVGAHGGIMFLSGDLGSIPTPINANRVQHYVRSTLAPVYGLSGAEQFEHVKTNVDRQNNTHTFFQQFVMFHGKRVEVDGGQLIVHASVDGNVFAVSSSLLAFNSDASYADVKIQHAGKQAIAAAVAKPDLALLSSPELVFLLHDDQAYFAYRAMVSYFHAEQNLPFQSRVFASPQTAELIVEFPMVFTLENRTIYTANQKTTLPGTLERTETSGKVNDQVVNQAFDNAGVCYEFYFKAFNRDSWDGKGAPMLSTVHYDKNYNNAFWNGQQMVYGDGDGVNFSDFAGDLSVVCHELTHAVVGTTAGLRYLGESGALNEAYADMMGSSAVIFNEGGLKATSWQIGNKCYLAGEALRYMNNPILDGVSRDYYPDRYVGIVDNGGVHWNSGIANLFFVLLVQGGVHPQQKTTNYVNPVGIVPALDIIYDTLVNYLTSTSNFAATRAAMVVSTKTLFPNNDAMLSSVNGAWTAVGVN